MASNEASRIYEVLKHMDRSEWRTFVRTTLELSSMEIEECEENYRGDLREQRFQMVRKWMNNKGRVATVDALEQLAENREVPAATQMQGSRNVPLSSPPHQHIVATPTDDIPNPLLTTVTSNPITLVEPAQSQLNVNSKRDPVSNHQGSTSQSAGTTPSQRPQQESNYPSAEPTTAQKSELGSNYQSAESPSPQRPNPCESQAKGGGSDVFVTQGLKAFSGGSTPPSQKVLPFKNTEAEDKIPGSPNASSPDLSSSREVVVQDIKRNKSFTKLMKGLFRTSGRKKKSNGAQNGGSHPSKNNDQNDCDLVSEVKVLTMSQTDMIATAAKKNSVYEIRNPKGCVLILNNSYQNDEKNGRLGSDKDVKNMKKLWQQMGCEIHRHEPQCEKTAQEMKDLLQEMTDLEQKYSFLVIVIMTHGGTENGELIFKGSDFKSVKVREIEKMFNNEGAKNLHDIPKFFIFQFCRGKKIDKGVVTDAFDDEFVQKQMKQFFPVVSQDKVETDGENRLPTTSDILIAYATQEEHAALRNPEQGSWFINGITNVFMKCASEEDVEHMLTKVHSAMKQKIGLFSKTDSNNQVVDQYEVKAMSKHESCLSKRLYLFPGYPK